MAGASGRRRRGARARTDRRRSVGRLGARRARRRELPTGVHRAGRGSQRRRRPAARLGRAKLSGALWDPARAVGAAAPVSERRGARTCARAFDAEKLLAVDEIRTWGATTEQKELAKHRARAARLEAARAAAGADSLRRSPKAATRATPGTSKEHLRFEAERAAFAEVEKRLACEGLLDAAQTQARRLRHRDADGDARLPAETRGAWIRPTSSAPTLEVLARPPLENDFLALRRVLTERADARRRASSKTGASASRSRTRRIRRIWAPTARATGFPTWRPRRVDATLAALGIATPEDAVAFFRRHARDDFAWLKVAVRLPPPPEYYSRAMDLSVEIDRGDVWYDFPFDAAGVRQPQPRERFPSFTLYVKWRGERVPLVRWRTTVGGWRGELAGRRAGVLPLQGLRRRPARLAPHRGRAGLDSAGVVAARARWSRRSASAGIYTRVTNYDETGPGYLSAYGMVAAIHEEMRKGPDGARFSDNGIRTHGSFDYLSLRGRFSHGCHRLVQPARDAAVQLRARRTGAARHRPVAARLPAGVLLAGRGVRDAAAEPRLLPRAPAADSGRGPGGADQGDADQTDRGLRSEAGRDVRVATRRRRRRTRRRTRRAGRRHERRSRSLAVAIAHRGLFGRRRRNRTLPRAEPAPVAEVSRSRRRPRRCPRDLGARARRRPRRRPAP